MLSLTSLVAMLQQAKQFAGIVRMQVQDFSVGRNCSVLLAIQGYRDFPVTPLTVVGLVFALASARVLVVAVL